MFHSTGYICEKSGIVRHPETGKSVGSKQQNGRVYVCVWDKSLKKNRKLLRSRMIWEAHNGPISKDLVVDHINAQRDDDRLENLRVLNRSENAKAGRKPSKDYSSRYRGVCKDRKWYRVSVSYDGKLHNCGNYKDEVEAAKEWDRLAFDCGYPVEALNFKDDYARRTRPSHLIHPKINKPHYPGR